ncbi:MAG: hypothetical protein QW728_08080 [Thermoplasmata archaeon]
MMVKDNSSNYNSGNNTLKKKKEVEGELLHAFKEVEFEYEVYTLRADGKEKVNKSSGVCRLTFYKDRLEYAPLLLRRLPLRAKKMYFSRLYDLIQDEDYLQFTVRTERKPEEGTPQFGFIVVHTEETLVFHIGTEESKEWYFRLKDLWKGTAAQRLHDGKLFKDYERSYKDGD